MRNWLGCPVRMRQEGLATQPRVARKGARVPASVPVEVPAAIPAEPQPSADEVLVKKRAIKVGQATGVSSSSWGGPP